MPTLQITQRLESWIEIMGRHRNIADTDPAPLL